MNASKFLRWAALLGAVTILGLAALTAGTAYAAKGGAATGGKGGKGGGGTGGGTAVCAVAPNPAAIGSTVTISGSGFRANVVVGITVSGSGGTQMGFAVTNSTGNLSTPWSASWPGTESVYVQDNGGASASCSFQTY